MLKTTRVLNAGALAFALALVGLVPDVQAQAPAPNAADTERARELFTRGMKAYKEGKWEESRSAYAAAWAMRRHWQVAGGLGEAELKVGRHRDAAEHLAFAVREGAIDPAAKDIANLRTALEEAKKKVGEVTLRSVPDRADVSVDGVALGTTPLVDPIYMDPGKHAVEVKKVGFLAKREELELRAGESKPLRVELSAAPSEGPTPPGTPQTPPITPPPPERETPPLWPGLVIGGGGLALLGAGIGVFAASGSAFSDAEDALGRIDQAGGSCEPASGPGSDACADAQSNVDSAQTLGPIGGVMMGVGGAALAGGIIYLIWAGTSDGAPSDARVVPWLDPAAGAAGVTGRF